MECSNEIFKSLQISSYLNSACTEIPTRDTEALVEELWTRSAVRSISTRAVGWLKATVPSTEEWGQHILTVYLHVSQCLGVQSYTLLQSWFWNPYSKESEWFGVTDQPQWGCSFCFNETIEASVLQRCVGHPVLKVIAKYASVLEVTSLKHGE